MKKLGFQAPKGYRIKDFNHITIYGDLRLCSSHNFLYNKMEEEIKLSNGEPCIFTDNRYKTSNYNIIGKENIYWDRMKTISLKTCIRKINKIKNIPLNTLINFQSKYYHPDKNIDFDFVYKNKKENKFEPNYEINIPEYFDNFTKDENSNNLVNILRKNNFIVRIDKNYNFLIGDDIEGEIATAYGHGKIIGFSSFNNPYKGYSYGIDNILWDKFEEFDKWSRCNEIPKTTDINEIIKILKS